MTAGALIPSVAPMLGKMKKSFAKKKSSPAPMGKSRPMLHANARFEPGKEKLGVTQFLWSGSCVYFAGIDGTGRQQMARQ